MRTKHRSLIRTLAPALALIVCGTSAISASAPGASPIEAFEGESLREGLLDVVVPLDIDFVIDPLEIAGRGQVYSEPRAIENRGELDLLFSITDTSLIFAGGTDFVREAQPFASSLNDAEKRIFLELRLGETAVVLTDDDIRSTPAAVTIRGAGNEDSRCPIGVTGSVNPYSETDWQDGDVKLRIVYRMEAVTNSGAEADEAEAGGEAEAEVPETNPGAKADEESPPASEEAQEAPDAGDAGAPAEAENADGGEDAAADPAAAEIPPDGEEEAEAPLQTEALPPESTEEESLENS